MNFLLRRYRFFTLVVLCGFLLSLSPYVSAASFPPNVNLKIVRSTWLGWYNSVRVKAKLIPYVYHSTLHRTATAWSQTALQRGYIDHKREGHTTYYDYQMIKKWFVAQGVAFRGADTLFTENIGWSPYVCDEKDCTKKMIATIRPIFDAYVAEKGQSYSPHYDSIASSFFTKIGLGIAVDDVAGKLYLTVHYARKIPQVSL